MASKPAADAQASLQTGAVSVGLEEAGECQWVGDGAYALYNMFTQGKVV